MTTFAANFVSCSAVKENSEKEKCLKCFELAERVLAYRSGIKFLVVYHMLPKCLLFVFRTPFI